MPGVKMHAFSTDDLPVTREGSSADPGPIGQAAGLAADHRATILLADPFSSPLNVLLLAVTGMALLLAGAASFIAWRVSQEQRRRSEARVAALSAAIYDDVERGVARPSAHRRSD